MPVRVKICGIRAPEDALIAVDAGADAIGVILAKARRQVTPEQARAIVAAIPPFVTPVGVFVDAVVDEVDRLARSLGLAAVQLHGDESPEACESLRERGHRVIKAFRIAGQVDRALLARYRAASAILLDTHVPGVMGGSGQTFTWAAAAGLSADRRLIVAGGLDPDNVTAALDLLQPYAVDVTSGVERQGRDGRKDPVKVQAFVDAVRAWDARQGAPRSPAAPPPSV